MAPSGSRAVSTSGEGASAEEGSKTTSICREGLSAEEHSNGISVSREGRSDVEDPIALSICGEGASPEEDLDGGDLTACCAENSDSKRVRRAVNEERSNSGSKLDVGIWSTLNDHLLEKIIARLPFRSLFQAPSLSKTWRLRVHSHSFQSEVHNCSSASSWESYTPLFVNEKRHLVGYESGSKRWCRLPTHSYLPVKMGTWGLMSVAGALFCWIYVPPPNARVDPSSSTRAFDVHVTNPLTKSWKRLPPRPKMDFPRFVHVGLQGNKAYQVLLGSLIQLDDDRRSVLIHVQIFDSNDSSWTMASYANANTGETCRAEWGGSAFLDGVLYVLVFTLSGYRAISFDVKEKVWKESPYLSEIFDDDQKPDQLLRRLVFDDGQDPVPLLRYMSRAISYSRVLVCRSIVMLVVVFVDHVLNPDYDPEKHDSRDSEELYGTFVSVFRLDLERYLAFELSGSPKEISGKWWGDIHAAAHGDGIYVGTRDIGSSFLIYNVKSQEWQWVDPAMDSPLFRRTSNVRRWEWTSVTYQPGLNPFLEV